MTKRKPGTGKVVGLKIETSRPEDSATNLALRLANSLQLEMNALQDARTFREQAARERQKAKEFSNTLIMLGEYNRKKAKAIKNGEIWKVSRMEPMETYDEKMVKEERVMLIERAKELENLAQNSDKIASDAKRETVELQKKLLKTKN